jgi:hypothetical protein
LLPGNFVFPSSTQKAADENCRSQKPPAVWICARTFGNMAAQNQCFDPPNPLQPLQNKGFNACNTEAAPKIRPLIG